MPVNPKLMAELIKKYGEEKGRRIYYAMENKGDPATKPAAVAKATGGKKSLIRKAMED